MGIDGLRKIHQWRTISNHGYVGIERGFGKYNDEKQYANIRKNGTSGRLFAETLRGFELSKKYISIGPIIWQMKAREMMTKRNGNKSMYRK